MPAASETRPSGPSRRSSTDRPGADLGRLVLGRYRITGRLAAGGSARVMRARDERLDRDVAVKLLHPHLVRQAGWRDRLVAEARAIAELSHPGIADVYDMDLDSDAPALVMELVEGESLEVVLARQATLPDRQVADIGSQVADALYLAHRRGFIHCDVKPGNIILERGTARARLVDFGIAQALAGRRADTADGATTIGTLRYMSPEQLSGEEVTPRTDIWSLGVVMYRAFVGTLPFPGPSATEIVDQQRAGPPPIPTRAGSRLEPVIRSCLQARPDDRPRHAGALAAMLRDGAPAAAAPVRHLDRAPRRGWPFRRTLAALGVAAMFMLGFFVVGRGGNGSAGPAPSADALPPLLAEYASACGEPADRDQLDGLSPTDAEAWLNDAIDSCAATPTPQPTATATPATEGAGGSAGGNGHGHGRGNGNGNGRGRGG